jgi:hypothetical protein
LALGPALLNNRGYDAPEAKETYRRASELAGRLNDDRARFAASWGLWITAQATGDDYNIRLRHLGDLVETAERIGDPELTLQAHHSSWATRIWRGEFARSLEHACEGLAIYDPDKHHYHALLYGGHDPGVCGKSQNGVALWALGYPDQALQSANESVALGEQLGHIPSALHALWFAATVYFLRRDAVASGECGARLVALAREHGLRLYQAQGGTIHSWSTTQLGGGEAALAELRSSFRFWANTSKVMLDVFAAALADAELRAGNIEQAAAALAKRIRWATVGGNRKSCGFAAICCGPASATEGRPPSICTGDQLPQRKASRPDRSNCARRWRSRGCGSSRTNAARRGNCWRRSTAGSPKASTRPI